MAERFVSIELLGLPELQAQLKALPYVVQRKIVRRGLRDAAKIHAAAAKAKAISLSKGKEGRLDEPFMPKVAAGIKVRALRRSRRGFGVAVHTPDRETLGIPPPKKGGKVRYPPAFIELGTKKTPALPYMRPAFDENEPRMTQVIADSVREGLDEVARGR